MMLLSFAAASGVVTLAVLVAGLISGHSRLAAGAILVAFGTLFAAIIEVPGFMGYPVPGALVSGDAVVLATIPGADSIYLVVRVPGSEPRLVVVPSSQQNRETAAEAQQRGQRGLVIAHFGRRGEPGQPAQDFALVDVPKSTLFPKTAP